MRAMVMRAVLTSLPKLRTGPPQPSGSIGLKPAYRFVSAMPFSSAAFIISTTLIECVSPAEPPMTVKSWLARWISRPPIEAAPVTTPSAGMSL